MAAAAGLQKHIDMHDDRGLHYHFEVQVSPEDLDPNVIGCYTHLLVLLPNQEKIISLSSRAFVQLPLEQRTSDYPPENRYYFSLENPNDSELHWLGNSFAASETEIHHLNARKGHRDAIYALAIQYLQDDGVVPYNPERAIAYFEKAQNLGHPRAAQWLDWIDQRLADSALQEAQVIMEAMHLDLEAIDPAAIEADAD